MAGLDWSEKVAFYKCPSKIFDNHQVILLTW